MEEDGVTGRNNNMDGQEQEEAGKSGTWKPEEDGETIGEERDLACDPAPSALITQHMPCYVPP